MRGPPHPHCVCCFSNELMPPQYETVASGGAVEPKNTCRFCLKENLPHSAQIIEIHMKAPLYGCFSHNYEKVQKDDGKVQKKYTVSQFM